MPNNLDQLLLRSYIGLFSTDFCICADTKTRSRKTFPRCGVKKLITLSGISLNVPRIPVSPGNIKIHNFLKIYIFGYVPRIPVSSGNIKIYVKKKMDLTGR
jgi:hypothetical protein